MYNLFFSYVRTTGTFYPGGVRHTWFSTLQVVGTWYLLPGPNRKNKLAFLTYVEVTVSRNSTVVSPTKHKQKYIMVVNYHHQKQHIAVGSQKGTFE